jgi:hypothetical protein
MPRIIAAGISTNPGNARQVLGGDEVWSAEMAFEVGEPAGEVFVAPQDNMTIVCLLANLLRQYFESLEKFPMIGARLCTNILS